MRDSLLYSSACAFVVLNSAFWQFFSHRTLPAPQAHPAFDASLEQTKEKKRKGAGRTYAPTGGNYESQLEMLSEVPVLVVSVFVTKESPACLPSWYLSR